MSLRISFLTYKAGRILLHMLALTLAASLVSCRRQSGSENQAAAQKTFASPDLAGAALLEAAKSGNRDSLIAIFGPESNDVLFSGDAVKDKNVREKFIAAYEQMHRWSARKSGDQVLYIGADNFAFPIPLTEKSSGQWAFNTAAGKDEILARRIGNDELTTIGVLTEIVSAEHGYFVRKHQFAQKFVSDEGQENGLYWPVAEGQPTSPLGHLAEEAKELGYAKSDKPQPFNGYYYKVLTEQGDGAKDGSKSYVVGGKLIGGFAVLAWPAKYRDSGVMTFLVGKDGVVYQKDLGQDTSSAAAAITAYDPANAWAVVLAPESSASVKSAKE